MTANRPFPSPGRLPPDRPLLLGTRASPLALAQAHEARSRLCAALNWPESRIAIVAAAAEGDRILDRPLAEIGGKALWTKALDAQLLAGEIDFAVHSGKDVETLRPPTIAIAAALPRADVRDRLVLAPGLTGTALADLPPNARIGTSSPRRAAQIRRARPDLQPVLFRGNVATRLARLARGEAEATLLAAAGLDRLGQDTVGYPLAIEEMLPAAAQGAILIEARAEDEPMLSLLSAINDPHTLQSVLVERALLATLGAGCHSPVAALATAEVLTAEILCADGSEWHRDTVSLDGTASARRQAAARLAHALLGRASIDLQAQFTPVASADL